MLVPLLVGAVQATTAIMNKDLLNSSGTWIRLLVVFDLIFLVACVLAFDYVIEE
jgi:ABC-type transport system involved in cytochrome c biogenesis permease component